MDIFICSSVIKTKAVLPPNILLGGISVGRPSRTWNGWDGFNFFLIHPTPRQHHICMSDWRPQGLPWPPVKFMCFGNRPHWCEKWKIWPKTKLSFIPPILMHGAREPKPWIATFPKGWLPRAKLKKIEEGIVGFGCNFGGMIAHLYRSHSPGYTQIRQG